LRGVLRFEFEVLSCHHNRKYGFINSKPKTQNLNKVNMLQSPTTPTLTHDQLLDRINGFIRGIGIIVEEGTVAPGSFLPAIEIRNGGIIYDPKLLEYPGDLLHEAGHIAVSLPEERSTLSGNIVENDQQKMGDEMAVLLWTWATSIHLGLPPQIVFHKDGYKGSSEWIIQQFSSGSYIGLPLLVWMKLCTESEFPKMLKWMRE
jgi:hypothetical protein